MSTVAKFFNTAGPIKANLHYKIDPLKRFDFEEILNLIDSEKYFIMHAPRQTGKTSSLLALRDYLNEQGKYYAVYANLEGGQAMRNDVKSVATGAVVDIARRACKVVGSNLPIELIQTANSISLDNNILSTYLSLLCEALSKPLVLFLDEIDALVGDSLVAVLRQIRSGYDSRPNSFPLSIILCGVRDVRDYRIHTSQNEIIAGGSAYNIKSESLRLGNFTKEEIRELYLLHTTETGQQFTDECIDIAWQYTEGQPWLVNALAYEVTYKIKENRDHSVVITADMMRQAKENIVLRRDTHIDILIDKLREERVRNVIAPILANHDTLDETAVQQDDVQYVIDLGLIVRDKPLRISNEIYKEVIPRELTWIKQQTLLQQSAWYINEDNSINMHKLLVDFQQFFRQNADSWIGAFDYKESGPQLLLQAFLQRIVNGGGFIQREYGLGRGRTDLLIIKPLTEGYGGPKQQIVLELKIKTTQALETLISKGLEQTAKYVDTCGNVNESHLIIFNRDGETPWDDKIWQRTETYNGKTIEVWGM